MKPTLDEEIREMEMEIKAPALTLLVKLGSIAVHADEFLSPHGHQFDQDALKSLLDDAEVKAWLKEMDELAFLPKKRK